MAIASKQAQRAIGLFSTRQAAESALHRLKDAGFDMGKVSVITDHDENLVDLEDKKSSQDQAEGGASAGAGAGAVTGGVIGLAGSLGILAIPGIGPLAEAGVLLANTLLGGGIGAASGGLIGALIGWGVPEEQAAFYNNRLVNNDEYLILVEGTEAEIRGAEAIIKDHGVHDWNIYNTPGTPIDNHGTGQVRPY